MRTTIGALALAGLLALTGCATATPSAPLSADATAATESPLDGEWRLVSAVDATGKLDLKTSITTVTLTGENTGGSAPCNSYRAEVVIGAGHDVTITPGATTKAACADTALTTVETRYLEALGRVVRTDIVENQLVLSNEDEKVALTYDAVPVIDTAALVGINWQLESTLTGAGDAAVAKEVTGGSILFNESDFTANGGCGDITGGWTLTGGVLLFTDVVSDAADCAKAELGQQKFVAASLAKSATIALDDTSLTLTAPSGSTGLLFRSSNN